MAETNFAALNPQQKVAWSREVWEAARDQMFIQRFLGSDGNSVIHRVTELTRTEKGDKALLPLVADLVNDGVVGDNEREGNEEGMVAYWDEISLDLISHGVKNTGKLSDQKSVVNFREQGRSKLSYWLANRSDQLAFLVMSGIGLGFKNDGSLRPASSQFASLSFASDVSAPTTNRHRNWTGSALVAGNTATVTASFTPSYNMIVDALAYAKTRYVKPLMEGGREYYVVFVRPETLAAIKKDSTYQSAIITAGNRGMSNPWFTGATVTVDGAVIHEHRLVYNTLGVASGSKWGAGGAVDGTRTLVCGAQAAGMLDLGPPEWSEKEFQYESQQGINIDKMLGLLKPKFHSIYDNATEDFGLVAIDHAI